ncbi:NUDIX hydrolase [Parenemella sanctibonifatiensis]|nr:NUDIX hydrolase [Parenemella sanctibonifatiensis]
MAQAEFKVNVKVGADGVGEMQWDDPPDADTLRRGVSLAADDALMAHGLRRLEINLRTDDRIGRRAVHAAGFRLEGIKRRYVRIDGEEVDVALYARLAEDIVYGERGFTSVMDSVLPTKRLIAHALLRDESGRLLYLSTNYKNDWELPGGVAERGESPRTAAEREVAEELGIEVPLSRVLVVDWLPPYQGWSDAIEFIFDGGVLTPAQVESIRLQQSEITDLHWTDVEEASGHLQPAIAERLRIAVAAIDGSDPVPTEAGRPLA